jgi:hypothetical protein
MSRRQDYSAFDLNNVADILDRVREDDREAERKAQEELARVSAPTVPDRLKPEEQALVSELRTADSVS